MVAPSTFSKDSSTGVGPTSPSTLVGSVLENTTATNHPTLLSAKVKNRLSQGIIMNPVVLSVISHFPNKCIPKKSQKYVINQLTSPSSEKKSGNELNNNSKKVVNQNQSKSNEKKKPSAKLKRYAGLLLAILSSMMFSFTGLIVKILNHHHPLTQATWMFIATVIVALPLNIIRYVYFYKVNQTLKKENGLERKESFKSFSDVTDDPVKVVGRVGIIGEKEKLALEQQDSQLSTGALPTVILPVTVNREHEERKRKIKLFLLLVIRACSGCSGMILYFYSLKYLNVGDSLVIVCSSPIFVFIIGYLFLGENCGVIPVLTIILSMVGVAVITRPPMLTGKDTFQPEDMIGAGLAFSSMLCIAMTIILMRFLQNVYHGLINLVFGIWGSIQTTALALAVGVLECPGNAQDAVLMGTTGVLFFLGQTFLAVALQFEEAGPVSLVRTSEVVFAFIWQFIFLNISPDLFSISGAGLILAGIILTICRKWVAALPEESKSRQMFSFILR